MSNRRPLPLTRRTAFTLVELLVAMALILFMMVILSEAFSAGFDSFRRSKAIGDLNSRLRTASTLLRRDLQADHFEGRKRLSDTTFWSLGPPREGCFRVWQGSNVTVTTPAPSTTVAGTYEGIDADGVRYVRSTDHMLHFTVKLRGNDRKDFFAAHVPPGSPLLTIPRADSRYQDSPETFTSQWAEVVYFLRPNGNFAGTTPLYTLYRRQLLLVPDNHEVNWDSAKRVPVSEQEKYVEISCKPNPQAPGFLYFNSPIDITVPQRRFGLDSSKTLNTTAGQYPGMPTVRPDPSDSRTWTYPTLAEEYAALEGGDLLLPDVLSFEVLISTGTDFAVLPSSITNSLFYDFAGLPTAVPPRPPKRTPRAFDTWTTVVDGAYDMYKDWNKLSTTTIVRPPIPSAIVYTNQGPERVPTQSSIKALRIQLRVWDVKTNQARQMTLIQDM